MGYCIHDARQAVNIINTGCYGTDFGCVSKRDISQYFLHKTFIINLVQHEHKHINNNKLITMVMIIENHLKNGLYLLILNSTVLCLYW